MKPGPISILSCVVIAASLQIRGATAAYAHADSPASPPLVPTTLKLQHADAARIIAVFSQPQLPAPTDHSPRAARVDEVGSLLPYGAEAVLRTRDPHEVTVVGTEAVPAVRDCIEVLDAAVEATGPQRMRVVLTPKHSKPAVLRSAVLQLPGAGIATLKGPRIVLEGSGDWLFRAERQVIRGELGLPLGK